MCGRVNTKSSRGKERVIARMPRSTEVVNAGECSTLVQIFQAASAVSCEMHLQKVTICPLAAENRLKKANRLLLPLPSAT